MLKQTSLILCSLLSTLLIITSINSNATGNVGSTMGKFNIDKSGAATYSIPINLPKGRAGLTPNVSLVYSSNNSSDGLLGVGWSLAGLSAITRCPQTHVHDDNHKQEVKFNKTDKFCLDGQRLILKSGVYGSDASTYHTEIDRFSTITAYGQALSSGPLYFEINNKAGETHYYGDASAVHTASNSNAFIEPGGRHTGEIALSWAISVIEDTHKNYIVFNYAKEFKAGINQGSIYIDNIQYTGSTLKGDAPFAEIDFIYQSYGKGIEGYLSGTYFIHNQILKRIDTKIDADIGRKADGNTYRSYFFEYENSPFIEERTLLTAIQECTDVDRINCLPGTTFSWQRPELLSNSTETELECVYEDYGNNEECFEVASTTTYQHYSSISSLTSVAGNDQSVQVFDINGDGYQDIIYVDNEAWRTKLGPDFDTVTTLGDIGDENYPYGLTIDYDGDGIRELLVASNEQTNWFVIGYQASEEQDYCPSEGLCTPTTNQYTMSVVNLGVMAIGLEGESQVMDINGDGMDDIVFRDGFALKAYVNNNGQFSQAITVYKFTALIDKHGLNYYDETRTASMKHASAIDINGDGRSDLISKVTTSLYHCFVEEEIRAYISNETQCNDEQGVWKNEITSRYELFISTGSQGEYTLTKYPLGASDINTLRVVDLNGDGLSDVMYVRGNFWYYRLSDGTQLLSERAAHLTTSDQTKHLDQFVDLNGDGRTDVFHAISSIHWKIYLSSPTLESKWLYFEYRGDKVFDEDATIRFGDINGDGKIDLLTGTKGLWKKHISREGKKEYVIKSITNGNGIAKNITYKAMTDSSVYLFQGSDNDISTETFSLHAGKQLVSRVETDSNTNAKTAVEYQYGGLLLHRKGRGSLGFQMFRTTDAQSGVITETQYSQAHDKNEFALAGIPIYTEQQLNGQLLSTQTNTLSVMTTAQGGYFPFISASTSNKYIYGSDGQSTHISQTITTKEYDTWGNLTNKSFTVTDQATLSTMKTVITNNFGNNDEQQYGLLQNSTLKKTRSGDNESNTRKISFSYNSDNMLQSREISHDGSASGVITHYVYDSYGNNTSISVTGDVTLNASIQTRTKTNQYDERGRYLKFKENALGERITYQYNEQSADAVTGIILSTSQIGSNGLTTTKTFDRFNQVTAIQFPKDITTNISQTYCHNECSIATAHYKVIKTTPNTATKEVFYNKWGQEIAKRVQGFNGQWVVSTTYYDEQGRKQHFSEPNSSLYFTSFTYDQLGRVQQIKRPNASTVLREIKGLTSKTTNELGQVAYVHHNGFGETVGTQDALGNTVTFTYNRYNKLLASKTTADGKSSTVSIVYDGRGRKTQTIDPIKGTWEYRYNAFDELISLKTAREHTFTYAYDKLGRKIRSYQENEGTLCWNYASTDGVATTSVGKLVSTAKYADKNVSCATQNTATIKKEFTYNTAGLLEDTTTTIDNQAYTQSVRYNQDLRPDITLYPQGESTFAVKNVYNAYGYLKEIRNNSNNQVLKSVNRINDRGQVEQQTFGGVISTTLQYREDNGWLNSITVTKGAEALNSVINTYDDLGNIKSRESDYSATIGSQIHYSETYGYDEINRLQHRDISINSGDFSLPAAFKENHTYNFDGWGNITFKTGVGYYQYDQTKVHQLLSVHSDADFTSSNALYTFTYDLNGNVTQDGNRQFTYASFDKPTSITNNSISTAMKYGVSRTLYGKEEIYEEDGQTITRKSLYLGTYEKIVRTSDKDNGETLTEHKYYIGDIIVTQRSNGSEDTYYLHKDHQGSIMATTDAKGNIISQAIYDPYGKRSEVYLDSLLANGSISPPTDRGYTDQKHLKKLGVIHMNGRIYDPTLGRFLQADPFIQAPKNSQSYNRYAYVLNNPLSYTDPSGYFWGEIGDFVKDHWVAIVVVVVVVVVVIIVVVAIIIATDGVGVAAAPLVVSSEEGLIVLEAIFVDDSGTASEIFVEVLKTLV